MENIKRIKNITTTIIPDFLIETKKQDIKYESEIIQKQKIQNIIKIKKRDMLGKNDLYIKGAIIKLNIK